MFLKDWPHRLLCRLSCWTMQRTPVATAKALLAGGVDVMEITFRTAAAADSIKAVAESCPDMLVGAGTVITLEQCKKAVECGAKFIVAPRL